VHFTQTPISGSWTIDPSPHLDDRGRFMRAWCTDEFEAHGIAFTPVQANMGLSTRKGTLRGMHYQVEPHGEAKLMRCTRGSIFDVLVDLRPGSKTYGQWFGVELSAENGRMLYIPPLCAHGYQTLEDETEIYYMTSARFAPSSARGLRFDDSTVGVRWPLPPISMSEQDRNWPLLHPDLTSSKQ
jgi:dTDP-4-dehydrorhamnose 3,5-epimerase